MLTAWPSTDFVIHVPTNPSIESLARALGGGHPGHDNRRGPGKRAVGPPSRTTGPGCYFAALQKYQSSATQLKSGFWGLKPQTFFATSLNSRAVSGCQMTGRFFARKFS